MKKRISLLALSSILIAGTAMASGYRIPEQSVDSVAKAGAYIASANHADAAYYNPANMSWLQNEGWLFEGSLTYIHLTSVSYDDNRSSSLDGSSETENFLLPTFFLVSPDMNNFRIGVSAIAPYGLSKRWEDPYQRSTAQEYTLNVYELNPTVSYAVSDMFSLAGGVRMIYSSAEVSNHAEQSSGVVFYRYLEGDAMEWGYNLAASLRPNKDMNISMTYRSNVDLGLEGDARMGTNYPSTYVMNVEADVDLPAPAVLTLSLAYTFGPTTIDLTWDRTFWSEYESIDIGYVTSVTHPVLSAAYGVPISKDWEDTDAYRIGLSYVLNDQVTLMAGFGYDETPIPDETLGFELPGSAAWLYSLGVRYRVSDVMEVGVGYLYDYKEEREIVQGTEMTDINGEFTDAAAHMLSVGLSYEF